MIMTMLVIKTKMKIINIRKINNRNLKKTNWVQISKSILI